MFHGGIQLVRWDINWSV